MPRVAKDKARRTKKLLKNATFFNVSKYFVF